MFLQSDAHEMFLYIVDGLLLLSVEPIDSNFSALLFKSYQIVFFVMGPNFRVDHHILGAPDIAQKTSKVSSIIFLHHFYHFMVYFGQLILHPKLHEFRLKVLLLLVVVYELIEEQTQFIVPVSRCESPS